MKKGKTFSGQGFVEYALILAGVALAAILILNISGISLREAYCRAVASLGGACDENKDCSFAFDNSSDLDAWESNSDSELSLEDGKACITGDGKSAQSYLNSRCSDSLLSDDYTISLSDVTVDKAIDNNQNTGFDTWFRAKDDKNGYLFIYNSRTNYVRFWKIVNGKWVRLAQKKVPSDWGNQELDFKIDVKGDTFTAYQDGEKLLEASDSAYTEGQIGMRNKPSSKSCVGDISVETISEETK
ncbi:MAG: hypothetical protein GY755_01090 [Chloroflexi bacterium]|nr:hypothetical protein [Chloroflexota bacterium]